MLPGALIDVLACPDHGVRLSQESEDLLRCERGEAFPIVQGMPILLREDERDAWSRNTWDLARRMASNGSALHVPEPLVPEAVDPDVQRWIFDSCGYLYKPLIGRLARYPIPELRLPPGDGRLFLDIGACWGRWSIAAARAGYRVVALDPSLDYALAGSRVARQLGLSIAYVVGDARALPFVPEYFDVAFSYSVLQHLDKSHTQSVAVEIARILKPSGIAMVQLANRWGLRQMINRAVQVATRDRNDFRLRYWSPREMTEAFSRIGNTRLSIDGFFSVNPQASDLDLLTRRHRLVVRTSEWLRQRGEKSPWLFRVADSLYVTAIREADDVRQ